MRTLFLIGGSVYMVTARTLPNDKGAASIAVVTKYLEAMDNNDYELMKSLLANNLESIP